MKEPKIYFTDGGVAGNGNYGFQKAVICATDGNGKQLFFKDSGDKTNNEAELLAILELLNTVKQKKLHIYSDSQLAVHLIDKSWHTDINRLRTILLNIWCIEKQFTVSWIPRTENKAGFLIEEKLGL